MGIPGYQVATCADLRGLGYKIALCRACHFWEELADRTTAASYHEELY